MRWVPSGGFECYCCCDDASQRGRCWRACATGTAGRRLAAMLGRSVCEYVYCVEGAGDARCCRPSSVEGVDGAPCRILVERAWRRARWCGTLPRWMRRITRTGQLIVKWHGASPLYRPSRRRARRSGGRHSAPCGIVCRGRRAGPAAYGVIATRDQSNRGVTCSRRRRFDERPPSNIRPRMGTRGRSRENKSA